MLTAFDLCLLHKVVTIYAAVYTVSASYADYCYNFQLFYAICIVL